jgi:endonuclease/exonuclease/phosphatase family metal-dependent hydrolase
VAALLRNGEHKVPPSSQLPAPSSCPRFAPGRMQRINQVIIYRLRLLPNRSLDHVARSYNYETAAMRSWPFHSHETHQQALSSTARMRASAVAAPLLIRLITHNIRYATTDPFEGEKPWADRAPRMIAELEFNTQYIDESFVCMQEVLHNQLADLLGGLNNVESSDPTANDTETEWTYIGVGRDDGKTDGEYSPIFFRPDVWQLEDWDTIWLSETPNKPSYGWDAASRRIVTIGRFNHIESGQRIVGMCTHLDDQGTTAREKGAELILTEVDKWKGEEDLPVFLGGDFNSLTDGAAYQVVTNSSSPMEDVYPLAGRTYGDQNTYTGFTDDTTAERIDFIFVGPKEKAYWKVNMYAVLANVFDDGVYLSDHRAVVADLQL